MKNWFQSRLVWSGILKIVAGSFTSIASLLSGDMEMQTFISGLVMSCWGIYDVVVRFDTSLGIKK